MAQDPVATAAAPPSPADRIARAAGLAGAATLTSRLLGLVREQVLAALFGAGNEMDAYLVAFRVPNLVRDLFAEGAMSAAFVPTFTRHLAVRGKDAAWRLGNNVLNTLVVVTALIVVAGIVFARPLVSLYAERFAEVPGKLELTTDLARIMLPFLTLIAVAAAVMGMLNALRHYFLPALAPATFNLVAIVFAVALTPVMPALGLPRITALAIATIVGGLTQVAIQLPSLRREGFRYRFTIDLRDPALREVLMLMGPGTIGLAATQLNLFVSTLLATSQGTGAVSWLQYAFRVMYLPLGIFGVSIATAVLPEAARHAALNDRTSIRDTVSRGLALMLMVNVPATCGLVVLAPEIIGLLFERGRFTSADTAATAFALRLYAVGLLGYSTSRIATPVFYALGRNRVPVALSSASVAANVVLSLVLVRVLGFGGLALATSLAALVNAAVCLLLLRRELGGLRGVWLGATFGKVAVASAAMTAAVVAVGVPLQRFASGGHAGVHAATLLAAIAVGLVTLDASARALRIEPFDDVRAQLIRRVRRLLNRSVESASPP